LSPSDRLGPFADNPTRAQPLADDNRRDRMSNPNTNQPPSRRDFLRASAGAAAATAATAWMPGAASAAVPDRKNDTLKIAVVGVGGRGRDAVVNCLDADPNVKLTVMADLFPDHLDSAYKTLKEIGKDRVDVPASRRFTGFDAYKKAAESDVDIVLLTAPPAYRPIHMAACLANNKHTFAEKPVAVDTPGLKAVLAMTQEYKAKNLNLVSGLCWRYHYGVAATMKKVLDGEIGDIVSVLAMQTVGELWERPVPSSASEIERQIRNWNKWTWLAGDMYLENHVHSLDLAAWALKDAVPVKALGTGGRENGKPESWGNTFDHHAIVYHFANGVFLQSYSRAQAGAAGIYETEIHGTKGIAKVPSTNGIRWHDGRRWKYDGETPNMYMVEQRALINAIREGRAINNGDYMCNSNAIAQLGRTASYTGQIVEMGQIMSSTEHLGPENMHAFGEYTPHPKAVPGKTRV
jgi:predicted dehydrogenase